MAVLTVVNSTRVSPGVDLAGTAAAGGGDSFVNTGVELVAFKNASVGDITVTFVTPVTVDGLAVADRTVVVAAASTKLVGPFPPGWYNDTFISGGAVNMTYSGVTTFTVTVIKPATS